MSNSSINPILKSLETAFLEGKLDAFQDLLRENKSKFNAGIFHYNLGTSFLKKKDYAAASYHLEKAYSFGERGPHLRNNLENARQELGFGQVEPSETLDMVFFKLLEIPSSLYLTLTLIFCLFSTLAYKFKIYRSFLFLIILCTISFWPFLGELYLKKFRYAIALKHSSIREGPSAIFSKSQILPAGSKVIIENSKDGWLYIRSPFHLSGWIKKEEIGIL